MPFANEDTATVTFLEHAGSYYAITAWHVIEAFEKAGKGAGGGAESYIVPVDPGVAIGPPFLQMPTRLGGQEVDVAIRPIPPAHIERLTKKRALSIVEGNDPSYLPAAAIAVGFPTAQKRDRANDQRMEMVGVHAVAECVGGDLQSDQLQFYSEVQIPPDVRSLSGMSGGPIFWSEGERFGLLGFVKEATPVTGHDPQSLFANPKIHFICERADTETLIEWLKYADDNWKAAREELNRTIAKGSGK